MLLVMGTRRRLLRKRYNPCHMAVVDDQHLLARCRSGDLDAFNGLVEIHQDRVYNL